MKAQDSTSLANRMIPNTLEDFVGQEHLLGDKKVLSTMLEHNILHSMIFFGPPACGKTSLANIIGQNFKDHFLSENASSLSIEKIHTLRENALLHPNEQFIIFVDEIHRLNKTKQDSFLSLIEKDSIILIGATTENPYFVLQPALRSRLFLYEFTPLSKLNKENLILNALSKDSILSKMDIKIDDSAKQLLLDYCTDVRNLFNSLELAIFMAPTGKQIHITKDLFLDIFPKANAFYNQSDSHYDTISAFIKSIRGSDVDSALYYLALMLKSGEDILYIARRLVILSCEDIGVAYPNALPHAMSCYHACEKIGMPQSSYILACETIFLATLPKSNSCSSAIDKAIQDVENGNIMAVPNHLRDNHYKSAKKLKRGEGYLFPHDYKNHYVRQDYTKNPVHYFESSHMGFEKQIEKWMDYLKISL